jgi:hypothetical protein
MENPVNITIDSAPASDGWGFVGRVLVGDREAYRTIRAHTTPSDALVATSGLLADVLGPLLAGQEWAEATEELQHAPLRSELGFGLSATHAEPGRPDGPSHDGTGPDTDGRP